MNPPFRRAYIVWCSTCQEIIGAVSKRSDAETWNCADESLDGSADHEKEIVKVRPVRAMENGPPLIPVEIKDGIPQIGDLNFIPRVFGKTPSGEPMNAPRVVKKK